MPQKDDLISEISKNIRKSKLISASDSEKIKCLEEAAFLLFSRINKTIALEYEPIIYELADSFINLKSFGNCMKICQLLPDDEEKRYIIQGNILKHYSSDLAVEKFKKAYNLNKSTISLASLCYELCDNKDYLEAIPYLKKMLTGNCSDEFLRLLYRSHIGAKDLESALETIDKIQIPTDIDTEIKIDLLKKLNLDNRLLSFVNDIDISKANIGLKTAILDAQAELLEKIGERDNSFTSYQEAIVCLKEITKSSENKDKTNCYIRISELFYKVEDYSQCLFWLEKVPDTNYKACYIRGMVLRWFESDSALVELMEAKKIDENDEIISMLAEYLFYLGDYPKAFEEFMALSPEFLKDDIVKKIALCHKYLGQYEKAILWFERLPVSHDIALELFHLYNITRENVKIFDILDKIKIQLLSCAQSLQIGIFLNEEKKSEKALVFLEHSCKSLEIAKYHLAKAYKNLGENTKYTQLLKDITADNLNRDEIFDLANCHLKDDKPDSAVKLLKAFCAKYPSDKEAFEFLASINLLTSL